MQEKSNITLAQVLHILKEKKEVSLNQIQLETGLSKSYLSRLTNGSRDNPSLQVLLKLADFFDTDVSDLLKSDLVIEEINEEEQEDKQEIEIDILFKEELDQVCREVWQEIQIYCNKEERVTVEDIKPILRKIHDLRILNRKLS
ncbi:helix-turn-helix domain-containing protein [Clostridium butyricum]|uniref:helix-turn-helix domain-containing protein n=1 Tax=Clostridium butyricum TaxID=1492 RepID=UPI0032C1EC8E